MALQDLTPQLRTRLSRMERAVGWFVILAVALLGFGFVYYVYNTAERKGWFKTKAPYFTYTDSATGLKEGDPVQLIGLEVGQITKIEPMRPYFPYNIYVQFDIKEPYYGYLWTEGSRAKINAADFLGKRVLEVTKGTNGYPAYTFYPLREVSPGEAQSLAAETTDKGEPRWRLGQEIFDATGTNRVFRAWTPLSQLPATLAATNLVILDASQKRTVMTGEWDNQSARYQVYRPGHPYWLPSEEAPALTERLQAIVGQVEKALPGILSLTNQLTSVLTNSANLTSNLNSAVVLARPAVSNLAAATAHLDQPGGLGEWLLPTNLNRQLEGTLGTANTTLTTANTNLAVLMENLNRSLDNLAGITSNLNQQVEANPQMLKAISDAVIHSDQFIQGLKHHWLLRSAFKEKKTNAPPPIPVLPLESPKGKEQ